jgi:hypothetical protein
LADVFLEYSAQVDVLKEHGFTGCGKTPMGLGFVTGHDFSRAVTATK